MKINKYLLIFAALAPLQNTQAQVAEEPNLAIEKAQKQSSVVTISKVIGRTLADLPNGQRVSLKPGMNIPEDTRILVWNKGVVEGTYNRTKCKFTITPGSSAGSTLNIKDDRQCATAISVINPEKFAKFFDASNPGCCVVKTVAANSGVVSSSCCVVRTITIPAPPATAIASNAVASALPLIPAAAISSVNPLILAGLAGGTGLLLIDSNEDPLPASPQ